MSRKTKRCKEKEALRQFRKEWKKIPPLVRASITVSAHRCMSDQHNRCKKDAEDLTSLMPRRAKVSGWFAEGYMRLCKLMVLLCNAADDEAVVRGMDQDTHSYSWRVVPPNASALRGLTAMAEADILKAAEEEVAKEIDKEVEKGLHFVLKRPDEKCGFCDDSVKHAPRCPVTLEAELRYLREQLAQKIETEAGAPPKEG